MKNSKLELWGVNSINDIGESIAQIAVFTDEIEAQKLAEQLQLTKDDKNLCRNIDDIDEAPIFYDVSLIAIYDTFEEYMKENHDFY